MARGLALLALLLLAPSQAVGWEDALARGREAAVGFRLEEAETALRQALEEARSDEKRPWAEPLVRYWLGDFYVRVPFAPGGDGAEAILRESAAGFERVLGPANLALVPVLLKLGQSQHERERFADAQATSAQLRAITEALGLPPIPVGPELDDPDRFFNGAVQMYRNKRGERRAPRTSLP